MGKRIFWIFVLLVIAATTGALMYIQSESFAQIAKAKIQAVASKEAGVDLNFERLKVGVLPPSLSLTNVDFQVQKAENPLGLRRDTVIKAESLGFSFRMFQAFSRGIAVNKIFFTNGEINLAIPKSKSQEKEKLSDIVHRPIQISLGENFTADIRQFEFKNTKLNLSWLEGEEESSASAQKITYLALTPSKQGTNIVANLEGVAISAGKIKETLRVLKVNADVKRDLVDISTVDLQRRDAALHGAGKIVGSIDNLETSKLDLDLILRGPISELADFDDSLESLSGEILADLKVVGLVKEPAVKGKVEVSRFRYGLWDLDKVLVNGSFGGGALVIDSFRIEQKGGILSLQNKLELPIPFAAEARAVQLKLENVRFEEFAGDLRRSVNNLKMGLSGAVGLKLDFAPENKKIVLSSMMIQPNLAVKELELNNQTFGKSRPYRRVFQLRPFQLTGAVQWKDGEVRVPEGTLAFASGSVEARGTVSDAKGFDLTGTAETIDLGKEVGDISGIPLTGNGGAKIHVHGPSSAVILDFDVKQRDASFVGFDFGEIDGRVRFDENKSYIHISDLKGRKNSATYLLNGSVNVGEGDDIALRASFGESNPNDIFAVFAKQLKDISWLPRGMSGTLQGEVTVGGGYEGELATLEIDSTFKGKNLSYQGEMLHELEAQALLSKGTLNARILRARKYESSIGGNIQYKLDGQMKYSLFAERGKLRSLDFVNAWGVPADGVFTFRSQGEGKWETLVSQSKFELRNAFMRTRAMPPMDITFDTFADHSEFKVAVSNHSEIAGRISRSAKGESSASLRLDNGNFDFLLCALNRRNCSDSGLALNLNGEAKARWLGGNWQALSGTGVLRDIDFSKSSFHLRSAAAVELTASNGLVEASRLILEGEQSKLLIKAKGKVDGSLLDTQIQGDSSLKLLEFVTPLIEEARGKMGVALSLNGNVSNAKFKGNIDLQDGFLRLGGLDAPVDGLNGRIRFADSRLSLDGLGGQMGGGSIQASGAIDIFLNRAPRFDVDLFLANNRVKFVPVNFAEISDGKLSLTGDKAPYLFSGTVRMRRVLMKNNFDVAGGKKGPQNARYLPEKIGGAKSFYEIRIRAIAENGVTVENNLLNAEFKGEVTLLNNFEFPQIVARAELVRGKLLFRNTAFTLDHAYIRAPNPEYFNPQFSIGGIANVDNYRISIFASGTIEKPKITLSSYPAIPQEDIVSLLAFGYRGEDARKVNPSDTSAITYSEVGTILLEQLQLNQNLQSKGLRVSVTPALAENEANIIRPNSTQTASPKVYLQTQIMKNMDAAFGGTVGSTQGQSLDARLEYRLGRKASVSAIYEQTPAGLDATDTKESYGADLKFRWGFK
jgi:hypothetical protein